MSAPFDEPAARTRMSWVRTLLGVAAVTVLVERGLVVREAPVAWLAAAAVPAVAFAAIVSTRARRLAGAVPMPIDRRLAVWSIVPVITLATIGVAAWRP